MKNIFKKIASRLLLATSAFCILHSALPAHAAGNYLAPQGIYIDGSTSTVTVGGTNLIVGVCLPSTTNYFNLNGANGSQADTNAWPKLGFTLGRDEGSPSRILAIQTQFACGGTSAGQETLRFAGSVDGSHWQTNPCPLIWNITANGTTQVQTLTNFDTGGYPFFTLFSRENTNAASTAFMTNNWISSAGKQFE